MRTPADTPGHTTKTVRDREAPGSNPGPPTISELKSVNQSFTEDAPSPLGVTDVSQILERLGPKAGLKAVPGPRFELAHHHQAADIPADARPRDREAAGANFRRPTKF